jgi:hypothetical protein
MEKEKHKSQNDSSHKHFKKQYILKKDKDADDLIKVKDSFSDPNQYLKKQKKMVIGNYSFKNKLKPSQKIISISSSQTLTVSPINYTQKNEQKLKKNFYPKSKSFTMNAESNNNKTKDKPKLIRNFSCINNYSCKTRYNNKNSYNTYMNNLENTNDRHEFGIHYQVKSLGDVFNIFKKYKYLEEENKSKGKSLVFGNKKMSNEIIKEIGKNFSEQEKILYYQKKLRNDSAIFSKSLSRKIKRKENDLLYNKIEEFRLKRQLIDLMEKHKTAREIFGANYWVANLRRPKTHKDIRFVYSNTNDNLAPDMIIDYADKDIEFINDPSLKNNKKYKYLLKNINIFKKTHKFNYPNFEKMTEIDIIKGKNILEQEFNEFKENTNINNTQFKLYKDPKELKKKNVIDLTCKESYDIKYRIQRNRSEVNEENKVQSAKIYKRKGLYRSKSLLGDFKIKDNKKKDKISYVKEALKMLKKEKKEKESQIKIIPYK